MPSILASSIREPTNTAPLTSAATPNTMCAETVAAVPMKQANTAAAKLSLIHI